MKTLVLVMIAFTLTGCGPLEINRMINATKKKAQPALVRQAALPYFSLDHNASTNANLPKEIASLPIFSEHPEYVDYWHSSTNALVFITGSGFCYWGMIICRELPEPQDTQSLHAVIIPWGDKAFLFRER